MFDGDHEMGSASPIRQINRCTITPAQLPGGAAAPSSRCELALWDLAMLSLQYIQKGHLFSIPSPSGNIDDIVDRLKRSLAVALAHFYPVAGRLVTESAPNGSSKGLSVHIECTGEGAEFIVAVADHLSIGDVLKPKYTPRFVRDFFPMDLAVNHDGHAAPLLVVQVTKLSDGIFVGCGFNHVLGDGTAFWNFFNTWAEISRGVHPISRPPVLDRWFGHGTQAPIVLPFGSSDEFVERHAPPTSLTERKFHFSSDSIARLKERANAEQCGEASSTISSFQAVSALVWRSITRARRLPEAQETRCHLAIDNRWRLRPPLPGAYFGNSLYAIDVARTAGELLAHDIGWAAELINRAVASHTDAAIRGRVEKWMKGPVIYRLSVFDEQSMMMGSSPRFDMYGCDFGWGKAVALRSGAAHKFDGKVSTYPGREGGGSMDLEVCLLPAYMSALESDEEFMSAVSELH